MTIRVLAATFGNKTTPCTEHWERMGLQIVAHKKPNLWEAYEPLQPSLIFDAVVVCVNQTRFDTKIKFREPFETVVLKALLYVKQVRGAPAAFTMYDGRRWRSVPVLVVGSRDDLEMVRLLSHDRTVLGNDPIVVPGNDFDLVDGLYSSNYGGDMIRRRAIEHRFALLSEFDAMGFVIRIERGRFMVGPAFAPRTELDGKYYYGPGDRRPRGFTTVHKDNFAVRVEIEAFEELVNRPGLQEVELQRFFETHPHFLSVAHKLRPKVKLGNGDGAILIPDLVLQPLFGAGDDSNWRLLELKLPSAPLLVGKGTRKRLSCRVLNAIAQLREYERHLEDLSHAENVRVLLGHPVRRPQLGVLIGRAGGHDCRTLNAAQAESATVRIITYDEILERQHIQLEFQRND